MRCLQDIGMIGYLGICSKQGAIFGDSHEYYHLNVIATSVGIKVKAPEMVGRARTLSMASSGKGTRTSIRQACQDAPRIDAIYLEIPWSG